VAETVIKRAFDDFTIPCGEGTKVCIHSEDTGLASAQIRLLAPEFLFSRGYQVTARNDSVPELRFSVDTLYVAITTKRSQEMGKHIVRTAEARIDMTITDRNGLRKRFNGRGTYTDEFPVSMAAAADTNEPYVIRQDTVMSTIKPVVFGAAVTVILWYLYSFRG
jgi:hypothetical protein